MSAQPLPFPTPQPSLRDLIREELERATTPDPSAVTDAVLVALDDAQWDEAARTGVATVVGQEIRRYRSKAMTKPDLPPQSAKLENLARVKKTRPELFTAWVLVGYDESGRAISKFLRDCNQSDLEAAAQIERDMGDANRATSYATAAKWDALARHLPNATALVGSLPLSTVEAIVDGA
jgi:hypothetical protein